mmetsp:Transcript_110023/g.173376  ORF Transcript_110023/g.173376 Transcript_110023/m.173376 type:complete len:205 (+) Transcript_110023:406-1020(+)
MASSALWICTLPSRKKIWQNVRFSRSPLISRASFRRERNFTPSAASSFIACRREPWQCVAANDSAVASHCCKWSPVLYISSAMFLLDSSEISSSPSGNASNSILSTVSIKLSNSSLCALNFFPLSAATLAASVIDAIFFSTTSTRPLNFRSCVLKDGEIPNFASFFFASITAFAAAHSLAAAPSMSKIFLHADFSPFGSAPFPK